MALDASVSFWLRRFKIATGVALFQLSTQAVSALTGFMLVRALEKNQYALFTIAASMTALSSTLCDLGSQTGLLSVGGQVYQDRRRLSQLVATAIRIRFRIVSIALLVVGPLSWYFLVRNNASWALATMMTLIILLGIIPSSFTAILVVPLQLLGKYRATQLAGLIGAICRLFSSAVAVLIAPVAVLCAFAVLLAQTAQYLALNGSARKVIDWTAEPVIEDRRALMRGVRALWFPTAFDAFQSQIGVWLLGLLGTPSGVADLGALSRFGAIFSVATAVIAAPIASTFARCQDRPQLGRLLLQSAVALGAFCGPLTLLGFLFPAPFVWLLGPSYGHFTNETGLYLMSGSIGMFSTLLWVLARSKMWVTYNWIIPPVTLLAQYVLLQFLDVTTVSGALYFTIGSSLVVAAIIGFAVLTGIRSMNTFTVNP